MSMINIFIDAFKRNTNRRLVSRIYSSLQMEKAEKDGRQNSAVDHKLSEDVLLTG